MKDERDGVELELSSDAEKKAQQARKKASGGVHKKQQNDTKLTTAEIRAKREARLSQLEQEERMSYEPYIEESKDKTFYIYALFIAIVISVISFYSIFSIAVKKSDTGANGDNATVSPDGKHDLDDDLASEYRDIRCYITNIDSEYKVIDVLNIENGETVQIVVSSSTSITDAYDRALVFGELELGDGLDINYIRANNMAVSIKEPSDFFTKVSKTGVSINTASGSVEYAGTVYYTTEYSIIKDKDGNDIELAEISPEDYVTFKGVSNYINYIAVEKGHGTIQFTNIDSVKNPKADINVRTLLDLSTYTSKVVAEGDYKVVVTGDNITPYIQYINVESGETEVIDLQLATGKLGNVFIVTNTPDIVLKINDKEYDENKPITLPYGEYVATASKLNYSTDTQSFTINKPSTNLVFNLVPVETNVVIEVATTPAGAEVYVDNQLVGITPIKFSVAEGNHSVKLKYPNKYDISFEIDGSETYYKYNFTLVDKPADVSSDTTDGANANGTTDGADANGTTDQVTQ